MLRITGGGVRICANVTPSKLVDPFIHSLKRNKMTPKRTEDLVFVHSNLRLLSRNSSHYKEEETKLWDIAGDDFSLDDNGILDIASLSIDEPELEIVFFNEDE